MDDMVRIRVKRCGDSKANPEWWQFRFEDADTGKLLPVADFKLRGGFNGGRDFITAEVTIEINEIDIEMPMVVWKESAE